MGRLNVALLRYLSKDDFRVLTAIEMGMKNHEVVPLALLSSVAGLSVSQCQKITHDLVKHKLCSYEHKKVMGYRLTFMGYDYLALKALANRDVLHSFGSQIGVGKESDIYAVTSGEDSKQHVLKIHRLGRTSFRKVKDKRDYLCHRRSTSWIYLSRLAAHKEYTFMKALHERGLPVPTPLDCNRHCVVMEMVEGYPLHQVHSVSDPSKLYDDLMNIIVKFAELGLIHCDFNEFNIMLKENDVPLVIDFPQMVSISHTNAECYFNKDVECVCEFFRRRFGYNNGWTPSLKDIVKRESVDELVNASGSTHQKSDCKVDHHSDFSDSEDVDFSEDDISEGSDNEEEIDYNSTITDGSPPSPSSLPHSFQSSDHTPSDHAPSDLLITDGARVRELVQRTIAKSKRQESLRTRKKFAKKNITPSGRKKGKKLQSFKPSLHAIWDY